MRSISIFFCKALGKFPTVCTFVFKRDKRSKVCFIVPLFQPLPFKKSQTNSNSANKAKQKMEVETATQQAPVDLSNDDLVSKLLEEDEMPDDGNASPKRSPSPKDEESESGDEESDNEEEGSDEEEEEEEEDYDEEEEQMEFDRALGADKALEEESADSLTLKRAKQVVRDHERAKRARIEAEKEQRKTNQKKEEDARRAARKQRNLDLKHKYSREGKEMLAAIRQKKEGLVKNARSLLSTKIKKMNKLKKAMEEAETAFKEAERLYKASHSVAFNFQENIKQINDVTDEKLTEIEVNLALKKAADVVRNANWDASNLQAIMAKVEKVVGDEKVTA